MRDEAFLNQFEQCTLPKEYFKHKGHLRIAWLYLGKYSFPEACDHIRSGIKRYAASLGASQIYHETMTMAWVRLVFNAMQTQRAETFADFEAANPQLFNSKLIHEYYSASLLQSDAAKQAWIEPDLKSL